MTISILVIVGATAIGLGVMASRHSPPRRLDSNAAQVVAGAFAGLVGALFVLVPQTDAVPDSLEEWFASVVTALIGGGALVWVWRLRHRDRRPERIGSLEEQ